MWQSDPEQIAAFGYDFEPLRDGLALEESEETWDKIADSLQHLTSIVNAYPDLTPQLTSASKSVARYIGKAILSDRSRLCGAAVECTCALATNLLRSFEALVPFLVPPLISLAGKPHKLSISRAKSCLQCIAEIAQVPSLIPHLRAVITNKSASLRLVAIDVTYTCLNCYNPTDLEVPARAEDIEEIIRRTARDANADVRKSSRRVFEAYKILLPDRVDSFVTPLTPTVRKYLDVKNKASKNAKAAPSSASNWPPESAILVSSSRTQNVPTAISRTADKGGTRPERPVSKLTTLNDGSNSTHPIVDKAEDEKVHVPYKTGPIRPPFPLNMSVQIPKEAREQRARAIRVIPPAIPEKRYVPPEASSSRAPIRPISIELQRPVQQVTILSESSKTQTNVLKRSGAQRPTRDELEKGRVEAKAMVVQPTKPMSSSLSEKVLKLPSREKAGKQGGSRHKVSASESNVLDERRRPITKDPTQARPPMASSSNPTIKDQQKGGTVGTKTESKSDARNVAHHPRKEHPPNEGKKVPEFKASTGSLVRELPPPFKEDNGKIKQQYPLPQPRPVIKSPVKPKKIRAGLTAPTLSQLARKNEAAKDAARRRSLERKKKAQLVKIQPLVIKKKAKDGVQSVKNAKLVSKDENMKASVVALQVHSEISSKHLTNLNAATVPNVIISQSEEVQNYNIAENPPRAPQDVHSVFGSSFPQPVGFLTPGKPSTLMVAKPGIIPPTPISSLFLKIQQGFEDSQGDETLPFPREECEDERGEVDGEPEELARIDFLMDGVDEMGIVIKSPRREAGKADGRLPTSRLDNFVKVREVECTT